jgi:DNA-binding transcriptional MocR family regulator
MNVQVRKYIRGSTAREIASDIETAIRDERLAPGEALPTVRATARALGISPATVAAGYRTLRERGLVTTGGRRGTRVSGRLRLARRLPTELPPGMRNLADGNPDPSLLPDLAPALAAIDATPHLYGQAANDPALLRLAARQFTADGIPAEHLTVVSGALDGLGRVLDVHLLRGDRVAVEDPAFTGVLDLLSARGLRPVPVEIDDRGLLPGALQRVLATGVEALILTPRAQNPTGAALDEPRARALRHVLRLYPDLLVLEDDHAGPVAGAPALTLCDAQRERWAVVRSVSKSLGPDLRLALLTGDSTTITQVESRTLVGMRWVSHVLQRLVLALWSQPQTRQCLRVAERAYTKRRKALVEALGAHGIPAHGRSGLNVWVPVPEEAPVVGRLRDLGWAVAAGERFRLASPPAIRICAARLAPGDAAHLAADLASILTLRPDLRAHPV